MNVAKLFHDLSVGPLSNIALALEGSGEIASEKQSKVIKYTNDALLRLYTRFVLKENDVLIELEDHITNYHLLSRFAESEYPESGEDYPYIKDLGREAFENDVLKIMAIYDSLGNPLPLNDVGRGGSYFTPQGNVLQVPRPISGMAISVLYQAKHAEIDADSPTLLQTEITLPVALEEALLSYVSYKIFSEINTQEANVKAQEHMTMYTELCKEAVEFDLVNSSISSTNTRFHRNGWV